MGEPADQDSKRFERLIAAIEANTNANARLLQELQTKRRRRSETKAARQRRLALEQPVVVTPLVAAAAARALRRIKAR